MKERTHRILVDGVWIDMTHSELRAKVPREVSDALLSRRLNATNSLVRLCRPVDTSKRRNGSAVPYYKGASA